MLVGIYDPVQPFAAPDTTFKTLVNLRAQIIRLNLDWNLIATRRPAQPTDPADPAYDWSRYDRVVQNAAKNKIQVLFTIVRHAEVGQRQAEGHEPRAAEDGRPALLRARGGQALQRLVQARRTASTLPPVRKWLAWNEPNNPVFLRPQWAKVGRRCAAVKKHHCVRFVARYAPVGAKAYVGICTAIWTGVHASHLAKEVVGCGAHRPARQQRRAEPASVDLADRVPAGPAQLRPEAQPLRRLRAPSVLQPAERVAGDDAEGQADGHARRTSRVLTKLLGKLYGSKKLWITEYGYQTSPPDRTFGVTWAKQAKYLTQAYAIARKNPRITMMLWFLLRDEGRVSGWQSGLFTVGGKKKPAYDAFRRLPH